MGFEISYQHVGLNRVGVFQQTARTKGPEGEKGREGEGEKRNEPWRRISDLVGANAETRDPKVRKRCVRKLVAWMDRRVSAQRVKIEAREWAAPKLTEAWGEFVGDWRRVERGGPSVEALCFQLGISRARLTSLLKETVGLSAGELLDGFKIRGLKKYLIGQLGEAARRLWGLPGSFAVQRCHFAGNDEPHPRPLPVSQGGENGLAGALHASNWAGGTPAPHKRALRAGAGGTTALHKRSRYFRTRAEEFSGLGDGAEEALRVSELLGSLDALREENDFRIEAFAVRLGFDSTAKFRAACLTVMGRTLAQLERVLAHEIVHYYLAAEDLELRKLAMRKDVLGFRAREVYWGCEDVPEEPFLDRWSANEAGKPGWLAKMREEFG